MSRMINNYTIKCELKDGTFTTVPYSMLRDKNLSDAQLLLLIEIFSDSVEFPISPEVYAERRGVTPRTIHNLLKSLETTGYLTRKQVGKEKSIPGLKKSGSSKIIYHYTVSEYGNLKKQSEEVKSVEPVELVKSTQAETKPSNLPTKEQLDKFIAWAEGLSDIKSNYLDSINTDKTLYDYAEMRRVGKLVKKYTPTEQVKEVKEVKDIEVLIKKNVLDIISKSDIKGTIDQVKHGTNKIVEEMIELYKTNPELVGEAEVKKKILYHNNNIVNEKTRNLNQKYQN